MTGTDPAALIFVSIASYRDAQLVPTIADCLAKAAFPERLRFGICWQHGPEESKLSYADDAQFRILDVPWQESRGACWARAAIMELYQGEGWYLQLDSHCRFVAGWDRTLIEAMGRTGSTRPILSSYPPAFRPGQREEMGGEPLLMAFQGFTPEGIPFMKPMPIPGWQHRTGAMRARFLAAGFLFAPGSFVADVPYDRGLYFVGEEATLTVRAFTSGYDLFHPCERVVWHDYLRTGATRHWDDHTGANEMVCSWSGLDDESKRKVQRVLRGESVADHGLGSFRTLAEYEAYAGLSFAERKAQNYTLLAEEPPNPEAAATWAAEVFPWLVRISLAAATLPEGSFDQPSFWYVSVQDDAGHELYRRDFLRAEIETLTGTEPEIAILCEFQSGIIPAAWSVWPVSRSRGWLRRINGALGEDDFTILLEEQP